MSPIVRLAPLLLLGGCFTPDVGGLAVEQIPYQTEYMQLDNVVIEPHTYDLFDCPDGSPANFFAVYQTDLTDPAPIVIVFHSGAFDYVFPRTDGTVPLPEDADAVHYQGATDRLSADWAANKVFETLGLSGESMDPGETNLGTLPAALADAGAFVLYPANCWGDLWHNEDGSTPNAYDADGGVHRNGRFFAWAMTAIASADPTLADTWKANLGLDNLTIPLDSSGVYLVGLGEGGRAIPELYRRSVPGESPTPVKGILVDSMMDNLYTLVTNDGSYRAYNDGLARIYPDYEDDDGDGDVTGDTHSGYRDDVREDIGYYSLARYFGEKPLTIPFGMYYSSRDPYVPASTIASLVDPTFVSANAAYVDFRDTGEDAHVFLNDDIMNAREAVDGLLGN